MRRLIGLLAVTLAVGVFGGPQPAAAAAFLAINGGTWSYSAALAQSPAGTAYFWGLSFGAGSVSYAYAYSFLGGSRAAAFAIARAGFGWRGAWYAQGFADPQADIGLGIPDLTPNSLSALVSGAPDAPTLASNLASEVSSDVTTAGAESSPGDTLVYDGPPSNGELNGVTFDTGNNGSSETNAIDELAVLVVNSNAESDFCAAIGDSGCNPESDQTNGSGDVTSIAGLLSDLGTDVVGEAIDTDPSNLGSDGTFSFPDIAVPSGDSIILVAEGDPIPEPTSVLLLAQGLLGLGLTVRRRRA